MAKIKFGEVKEEVVTREEFPLEKARKILKEDVIAVIGYGVQGPAQALNLRDNGFNVIIGQRKGGSSWKKAVEDGWVIGKTLFEIEEAAEKGTVILYLLSDAGQISVWPTIKKHLTEGKVLNFSHGFGVTFKKHTKIVPPKNIDVSLVAPKGAGRTVRTLFINGKGINSSFAVWQDFTGKAREKTLALGIGIGSGYLFETTMENEVYSDLTGERGILIGALAGVLEAQYEVLRKNGHSPSEAFNETVEEFTQSLVPLMAAKGVDWLIANCSTTAQRGALDWAPKFKKAVTPTFKELYKSVRTGKEAERTIKLNSKKDYRSGLEKELKKVRSHEMWRAGEVVRSLRPENQ